MTDPEPLARVTANPFAKALLESAREDHSAAGAGQRALGALGLSATTAVVAHGSALGAAKAGSAASGSLFAGKGLIVAAQFAALGLLGGSAVIGAASYALTPASTTHVAQPLPSRASTPAPALAEPLPPDELLGPAMPSSVPELSLPPHAHEGVVLNSAAAQAHDSLPSAAAFPTTSAVSPEDLSAQLSELRAARSLLGKPDAALSLLDAFGRDYPASPLAEEATMLRIEALADAGRQSDANALGKAFLHKHPHSAYAQHVRSKLGLP